MSKFSELINKAREHNSYWEESAKHEFALQLMQRIQEAELNQKDFAARAGVSESQVSQILAGSKNLSLKTMLKYAMALDCIVRVEVVPRNKAGAKKKIATAQLVNDNNENREWKKFSRSSHVHAQPRRSYWELNHWADESEWDYHPGNEARVAEAA